MDVKLFTQILRDPHFFDLKKMQYKYGSTAIAACLNELATSHYASLPLRDFSGQALVYLPYKLQVRPLSMKLLLMPSSEARPYSVAAMSQEIFDSLRIENIHSSRESIREILSDGYAKPSSPYLSGGGYGNPSSPYLSAGEAVRFSPPYRESTPSSLPSEGTPLSSQQQEEAKFSSEASAELILGMKKALDLLSQPGYKLSEKHLYEIYQLAIGPSLTAENHLPPGAYYRNAPVYVVGRQMGEHVHLGLDEDKLPDYMAEFMAFCQREDELDALVKAAILHFYLAYLHPYFDGNGRTARLLHLWYLLQAGFPATLHVAFSSYIEASKAAYYRAFKLVEQNKKISGVLDVTPFVSYFIEQVYNRLPSSLPAPDLLQHFRSLQLQGQITPKEEALWQFVLNHYGQDAFSSKQLEKDFGQAAYATIYKFLQKFRQFGLLEASNLSARPRYKIRG